jgi:hypothetical protein
VPSRKNLISIVASLEQAGVQFIPEDVSAGLGPGVRLRQLQLEYSKDLRADGWDLIFRVRFKGHDCLVTITREIIDNIARGNLATPADRVKVVERRLPEFLNAVEKHLSQTAEVPLRSATTSRRWSRSRPRSPMRSAQPSALAQTASTDGERWTHAAQ